MSIFRKKMTRIYAAIQSALGEAATITGDHALLWLNDSNFVQPKTELVDRGIGPTGAWPSSVYAVGRWGEGGINLELRGSGTAGQAPEYSPLLETLLGTLYTNAADTVNGAGTTTVFTASAETFHVGQLARVEINGNFEVRRISAVSGQDITVNRAFSQAPADGAVIAAGVTYLHLGTEAVKYLTLDQYLDGVRLLCVDAVSESLSVSITARDIIRGNFGLRSLSCDNSGTEDPNTPNYNTTNPLGGVLCNLVRNAVAYEMKSLEFNLTTRRARGGVNSPGYSELPWSGQFEATATMTPWVEDAVPFTDFFAGATVNAEMTKGTAAGNILHIELAGLQSTGPEIGEDEGDFSWNDPLTITEGVFIGLF